MKKNIFKFILGSILVICGLAGCNETTECTNHVWDNGVITTAPSATTSGIKTFTCTICNQTSTQIIPAENNCEHVWDNGIVTKPATATEEGVRKFTCTKCSEIKTEPIPAGTVANKFKVTYDANGGSGAELVDSNEYTSGSKVTVKENTFTAPAGMEFINWCEEADGSGSYHNPYSTFKIYDNVTLYAQWLEEDVNQTIHSIKTNAPSGVTCKLSQTKAEEGEEITLTLTLAAGTSLNGDPTSSQVSLTKVSALVYKFTMPNYNVTINIKGTIDGDVVLTGDLTEKLTDDDNDGIFSAEIACDSKTTYNFSYVVKNAQGEPTKLSSLKLDETRTNADVTFTSGENQLSIAGGATYTFYYDSNASDYNCYIVRKTVDVLPSNSKTLYSLFDGKMRSQSTIHPQGLTSIHYTKTVDGNDATLGYKVTNEEYDYKKISDTESFAVSTNKASDNKKSYVYKNIDTTKDVYSIINTYVPSEGNNEASDNVWTLDPYGDMQGNRYFPYSARQDVVENSKYRDTSRYQITSREAYRNVSMAAHYGAALEYEIYKSVRGDFDGTAMINAANAEGSHISIVSTRGNNNGFQTVVASQLEYNHEESGSTADVTQQYAFIFNVTMDFKANGDLSSMNYNEKYYSKDNWDFAEHKPLDGGTAITTVINVTNNFNETFNRTNVLGSFKPADYFITSIDKLSFYDETTGQAKETATSVMNFDSSLDIIEYLGGGEPTKLVDEFVYSPSTALDAWQYGCISSSDEAVIGETPWGLKTVGTGSAVATFGNHLENINGPTKDVSITVYAGGTFSSLFVNANIRGYDSYQAEHAQKIVGYAGKTMNYYIDSGSNTGCPVSYYIVIETKNSKGQTSNKNTSPYFNIVNGVGTEYDAEDDQYYTKIIGHELILDFNTEASNALTSKVSIHVYFCSKFFVTGRGPGDFTIEVNPAQKALAGSKFACDAYYYKEGTEILSSDKYDHIEIEFKTDGTGVITQTLYTRTGAVEGVNIFNFTYIEKSNGSPEVRITSVNICDAGLDLGFSTSPSDYTVVMERQSDGSIGVGMYTYDVDIIGYSDTDDEGYPISESLALFEKIGA